MTGNASSNARIAGGSQDSANLAPETPKVILRFTKVRTTAYHVQFAVIPIGPSVAVLRHGIGVEAASDTADACMTGMVRDGGGRPLRYATQAHVTKNPGEALMVGTTQ